MRTILAHQSSTRSQDEITGRLRSCDARTTQYCDKSRMERSWRRWTAWGQGSWRFRGPWMVHDGL